MPGIMHHQRPVRGEGQHLIAPPHPDEIMDVCRLTVLSPQVGPVLSKIFNLVFRRIPNRNSLECISSLWIRGLSLCRNLLVLVPLLVYRGFASKQPLLLCLFS
jgi:hypothetical protein